SSEALASAYGIAVTGTMVLTTVLGVLYLCHARGLALPLALLLVAPVLGLELVFLASNLTKIADGGYVPLLAALVTGGLMGIWWRGTQSVSARMARLAVDLAGFVRHMEKSSVHRI